MINIYVKKTKLDYQTIISTLVKICQNHSIKLVLNDPMIGKDNGCAYETNEIHLGKKYSSNLILLAIFFHEFSHTIIARK